MIDSTPGEHFATNDGQNPRALTIGQKVSIPRQSRGPYGVSRSKRLERGR